MIAKHAVMPHTFIIGTGLSFVFSSSILALSPFSFAAVSFWLNMIVAGSTIVYNSAIMVLSCRRTLKTVVSTGDADGSSAPRVTPPTAIAYTGRSVRCIILLFGMWLVALGISIQATVKGPLRSERNTPSNRGVQFAGLILLAFQALIAGSLMLHCIVGRKRARSSIESVRAIQEKRLFLPSPVEAPSPLPSPITPPIEPPIYNIRLHMPVPAKTGYRRAETAWNDVTPGLLPPLQSEWSLRTLADFDFMLVGKNEDTLPPSAMKSTTRSKSMRSHVRSLPRSPAPVRKIVRFEILETQNSEWSPR